MLSLVLKKKVKVKEDEYLNTVDLRGIKLREKQLKRIVDIKLRVLNSSVSSEQVLQEQKAPKEWVSRQKTYPRPWRFFQVPQMLLRTVAVLLIIGLNWTAFAAVGTTVAIFHDEENAGGTLSAGSVEFSLTVSPFDTIAASLNLETGTSTSKSALVLPTGESNPFQYYASSTDFTGDEYFCDALLVNISVEGTEIFNGPLEDFVTATTTALDTWEFTFTTTTDHPNSVCHFNIDFNGWQTRNDLPNYEEGGYTDTETISNSIYSSGFRIQKVYFDHEAGATIVTGDATAEASVVNIINTNTTVIDTCCDDDCDPSDECECGDVVVVNDNDATVINNVTAVANTGGNSADGGDGAIARRGWVEIYNQTNVALDFSGWKICDDIACDTIPSDMASIMPHGFAVIAEDETLWHEWNIPDNVVMIALPDRTIGGGLNYETDMLLIKRPDDIVIDQMNWGVPSPAWLNYNSDVWDLGISVSTSTEILAREPLGHDTNQPEDFVELGLPVVDLLYPDEDDDSNVWYWGQNYNITWTANNQNGDDEELLVDIFAVFDENGNGYLDDEDTELTVVSGTENDEEYLWTVPTGFIATIWIQVVAVGPENPMLFSSTISGDIWDPIPEEMAESYKDEYFAQQLGFKGFRVGVAPVQAPVQGQSALVGVTETEEVEEPVGEEESEGTADEEIPGEVVEGEGVPADETEEVDDPMSEPADEETLPDEDPPVGEGEGLATPELDGVPEELPEEQRDIEQVPEGEMTLPESDEVPPEDGEVVEDPPADEEEPEPEQQEETEPEAEATLPEETQTNTEEN